MVVVAPVDGPVEPALQVAEDLAAEGAAVTVLVADDRDAVEYRGPVAVRRMKVRAARAAGRPTRARRAAGAALSRPPRGWRYVLPHVEEHEAVAGGHLDQAVAVAVVGVGTDTAVAAARAVGRAQLRHRTVRWVHVDVAGRGPAERIAPEAARLSGSPTSGTDVVVPAGGDVGAAVRVAVAPRGRWTRPAGRARSSSRRSRGPPRPSTGPPSCRCGSVRPGEHGRTGVGVGQGARAGPSRRVDPRADGRPRVGPAVPGRRGGPGVRLQP